MIDALSMFYVSGISILSSRKFDIISILAIFFYGCAS